MSPKYAKDQPAGFVNRIEKVAIVGVRGFFFFPSTILISAYDPERKNLTKLSSRLEGTLAVISPNISSRRVSTS